MDNKKTTVLLYVTLTLVAITLGCVFISGSAKAVAATTAGTADDPAEDSITVFGQGVVYIKPDVAYITLGYENLDKDPKKAQDDNSAQMDKIIKAVKDAGIEDADIQTSRYNVNQDYDYVNDKKEILGYRVTNTILVTVKDVAKAGDVIKAAYDAGSNLFDGITFDIIKRQESYLKALDIAMERAKEKAEKLARGSGRSITGVINIVESSPAYSPYYTLSNFAYAQPAAAADNAGGAISSGELQISATVNVTYRLN
jgi:uncharacterized protein YggE